MKYPIDVAMSGAVSLGPDIVCDGFMHDAKVRIQTHVHKDHMDGFESSKGFQEILLSKPTLELLIFEFNADLPYRTNLRVLGGGEICQTNDCKVQFIPSGHMLGGVQTLVERRDGLRMGYSSDFQWPLDHTIEVEALVVDSTYGSPNSVRRYNQGECESRLLDLIKRLLRDGAVYIYAHRGSLQRALQLLSAEVDCPIVGSTRLCKEISVYKNFGYPIDDLVPGESVEGKDILRSGRFIRFFGTGDQRPADTESVSVVKLSAYFSKPDEPVTEYSPRSFGVALSNHADFDGTIEYVRSTGAKYVVTDNSRGGKGYELALELKQRLGIDARPSSSSHARAWGS